VVDTEQRLLSHGGHRVERLEFSNYAIASAPEAARTAALSIYNPASRRRTTDAIQLLKPDVLHVHNFFPVASPSVFDAAHEAGVATVLTLHNYRLGCLNGFFFRDGHVCQDCLGRLPLPGVRHRCYRGSAAGSAAVATMLAVHRARRTWHTRVDRFVALTEFARRTFEEIGRPPERLSVKANCAARPPLSPARRDGFVFVGCLSVEKGVDVLLKAWAHRPEPLTIVGEGPDSVRLKALASPTTRFTGGLPKDEVLRRMAGAHAVLLPSLWFEGFPMTVAEAFSTGTPVVASRIGALAAIVTDGHDGLHFKPGDAADLDRVIGSGEGQAERFARLGQGAASTWETSLSPAASLRALETIYARAIVSRAAAQLPRIER